MHASHLNLIREIGRPSLKLQIKSVLFFCLYYTGIEWLLARLIRVNSVAILMYHGVCDHAAIPAHINFHLEAAIFERQMRALKRRYRVVPLADIVKALSKGVRIEKAVALTFDDGYQNNARQAAPILDRLGLPYTIFVATAYVERQDWMPLNEVYWRWSQGELSTDRMSYLRQQIRGTPADKVQEELKALRQQPVSKIGGEESFAMLNWDEIRSLAGKGTDFGSHTHSHCNMAVESPSQQEMELLTSKRALEAHLGHPVRLFAYPYGRLEHMSKISRSTVIATGYDCAVSATYGLVTTQTDRFCLPRLGYDRRIWMFTGEILYQFIRQACQDAWLKLSGRSTVNQDPS